MNAKKISNTSDKEYQIIMSPLLSKRFDKLELKKWHDDVMIQ